MSDFSGTNSVINRLDADAGGRFNLPAIPDGAFSPAASAWLGQILGQVFDNGRTNQRNWQRMKQFTDAGFFTLATGTNPASTGGTLLTAGSNVTIDFTAAAGTNKAVFTVNAGATSGTFRASIDAYFTMTVPAAGGTASVTLNTAIDWRGAALVWDARGAYNVTAANLATNYNAQSPKNLTANIQDPDTSYPFDFIGMSVGSVNCYATIAANGNLIAHFSVVAGESGTNVLRVAFHVFCYGLTEPAAPYTNLVLA